MGRDRVDLLLDGEEATRCFAEKLASSLSANTIIALYGDLGAGKTTFMQGLIRGLGGKEEMVQSPTFVYLHLYPTALPVFHFDLYRLRTAKEFTSMGFDEYFENGGITAIEWPERIASILPASAIGVHLTHISENVRRLVMP